MREVGDGREIDKETVHRMREWLPWAYTDVESAESSELTPYVIQEVLLLLCEAEV